MRHFAIPKGDTETHTHTLGETRGKTKLKGVYVCCDSQIIVYIFKNISVQ